jgi:dihydrodipicolinate synthase/N-acetylneuraminate lyase
MRAAVIETALEEAGGRVPVVAGVMDATHDDFFVLTAAR